MYGRKNIQAHTEYFGSEISKKETLYVTKALMREIEKSSGSNKTDFLRRMSIESLWNLLIQGNTTSTLEKCKPSFVRWKVWVFYRYSRNQCTPEGIYDKPVISGFVVTRQNLICGYSVY
jgi:hypothetical protein